MTWRPLTPTEQLWLDTEAVAKKAADQVAGDMKRLGIGPVARRKARRRIRESLRPTEPFPPTKT